MIRQTPAQLLDRIREADRAHWSQPSNGLAIRIHEMEREFEAMTGSPCPAWPQRAEGGAA